MFDRRQWLRNLLGLQLLWAGGARAAPATLEVEIRDYQFHPAKLSVSVGDSVRWVNREKRTTHTVLFAGPQGGESERLFPGEHWQRLFDRAGSYAYGCGPHPEMQGLIVVNPPS
ncbi:plastocyanin/azurin family copper-binding protein [Roseateles sp.]|uniref:plastocyanin/azurin family copper-binding protein n=1 Tax=Roseateles sp. TaxID=1971397 RepID=UPI00286C6205|nr:plastocyanin/azurin family copper-binding protein [Roseateles sp.]